MSEQERLLNERAEQEMLKMARHFTDVAEATLQFKGMDPAEREELQRACSIFKEWFPLWIKQVPDDLHHELWDALMQAYIIGSRGTTTKSARRLHRGEPLQEARAQKRKNANPLKLEKEEMFRQLRQEGKLTLPNKLLLNEFNKRLAERGHPQISLESLKRLKSSLK